MKSCCFLVHASAAFSRVIFYQPRDAIKAGRWEPAVNLKALGKTLSSLTSPILPIKFNLRARRMLLREDGKKRFNVVYIKTSSLASPQSGARADLPLTNGSAAQPWGHNLTPASHLLTSACLSEAFSVVIRAIQTGGSHPYMDRTPFFCQTFGNAVCILYENADRD